MTNSISVVPTEFGPETWFEVNPVPAAPFRARSENDLERLKRRLLTERLDEALDAESNSSIRRAANEAASLAWTTPYPLLVFPVLFDEKAGAAVERVERQAQVRRVTRELLAV